MTPDIEKALEELAEWIRQAEDVGFFTGDAAAALRTLREYIEELERARSEQEGWANNYRRGLEASERGYAALRAENERLRRAWHGEADEAVARAEVSRCA